ncbi:MAG TPA: RlmE family RNA methyltransferase [Nitrososphaerales archaeon]|nr:RlmE family RNA methyltransferase [Nitrososphaerales archaeon]
MRLNEARRDLYRRLAREQGYKSRAAFKLIEANERYQFIKEGGKVVDFGSAPGGWLQVVSALVGPGGLVVGVDLQAVKLKERNIVFLKSDVNDPNLPSKVTKALGGKADALLSDLSPEVSGVWELDQTTQVDLTLRALELSSSLLKPSGGAFFKLFEGERAQEVRDEFRKRFSVVRVIKPAASRNASSELYYYCEGIRQLIARPESSR